MQLSEAKMLYDSGGLTEAIFSQSDDLSGWCVRFNTLKPVDFILELETQKGSIRVFKSLEGAVTALRKIGFQKAILLFD